MTTYQQLRFEEERWEQKPREIIFEAAQKLRCYHLEGILGGEKMTSRKHASSSDMFQWEFTTV